MGYVLAGLRAVLVPVLAASWLATVSVVPAAPPAKAAVSAKDATSLITDYYGSILQRAPDAGGLAYWQQQAALIQALGANGNETWRALAITFFNSAEYRALNRTTTQYLGDLYATFFKRPPDSGGLAYWSGQIQSGQTRQGVLLWFLFSAEFDGYMKGLFGDTSARAESDMVVDFYRGILGRLPDEGGYRHWVTRLRAAQCTGEQAVLNEVEEISRAFANSPDYANRRRQDHEFLTDMYDAFMRRGSDLAGFMEWGQRMRTGLTRDAVRRAFLASSEFQARVRAVLAQGCYTLATDSGLAAVVTDQSVSPFLATVELRGTNLAFITSVTFTVKPRAGSVSRPVKATYSPGWLTANGYGNTTPGAYRVPVFGLYANHSNSVAAEVKFTDGSVAALDVPIATAAFVDPTGVYDQPAFLRRRAAGSSLGFDFFYIKSEITTPLVIDTDGEVRWWVPGDAYSVSTLFERNGFTAAVPPMRLVRTELDGRRSEVPIAAPYYQTHHSLDPGRTGVLVEVDDRVNGVIDWEHILVEVAPGGTTIAEWNLGDIISRHMAANGDDPSQFVRFGIDWFHMNAAAYDPRDDSVILSSRENFVIKVKYQTGEIVWILGDPTKYWYTFPSLRAKALQLEPPGLYPIGQHAVSITSDGLLLLFNNGAASLNNPAGTSRGESRAYSVVSAYEINPLTLTAREARRFDYGNSVSSQFCSSAYEASQSLLVSYSRASNGTKARLVGVDPQQQVVFDFEYVNLGGCNTSFSAGPIAFDAMVFP